MSSSEQWCIYREGSVYVVSPHHHANALMVSDKETARKVCDAINRNVLNLEVGRVSILTRRGEYKGNALLQILKAEGDERAHFQFGLGKAQKVIASLDEIQDFVDKVDNLGLDEKEAGKLTLKKDADDKYPFEVTVYQCRLLLREVDAIAIFIQEEEAKKSGGS